MSSDPPTPADAPSESGPAEPLTAAEAPAEAAETTAEPAADAKPKAPPDPGDEQVTLGQGWAVLRRWPWTKQLAFAFALLFTLYHIGAVLLRGAPKKWREPLWPLASWYAEDLRMTDTWGMFSLPPKDKLVSVVGITASGERIEISHVQQNERDLGRRIIDIRLRKIQTKLADEKSRNHWGWGYVKYFCQDALARGVPITRIQLELQKDEGKEPEVFLKQSCRPKPKTTQVSR